VALAGPAVNVALAILLFALVRLTGQLPAMSLYDFDVFTSVRAFLYQFVLVNVVLALFNLLPAFPMDGGRVLRALLAMRMSSYARATGIAARIGRALALVLGAAGMYELRNPFWVLIALFVWIGARNELAAVREVHAPRAASVLVVPIDSVPHEPVVE
jgi:Zn-dependent protease